MAARDYGKAAAEVGISANWLRRHARQLPHSRAGRSYFWDDADLAALREFLRVRPDTAAPSASDLRPVQRRTRRAS